MSNREYKHHQDTAMNLIEDPIISDSDSPCVRKGGHFLASRRKRIVSQTLNLRGHTTLHLTRQFLQLPKRKRFELNAVGHNRRLSHSRSFFFTVSQGILFGSFSASRAAAMSISSSSFSSRSTSSIGTTAATAFFPRCTITLSPRYAARLRTSEKFCRAALAVSFVAIRATPNKPVQ
jgi:hypothetical protein